MPHDQVVILKNLSKFVLIESREYLAQLEAERQEQLLQSPSKITSINLKFNKLIKDHKEFIDNFTKEINKDGYCVGFSICHGAMNIMGKLNWWESVLVELTMWEDGKDGGLDEKIDLPDSDNENVTRRDIFRRALDYIIYNFSSSDESYTNFIPKGLNQFNFLNPDSHIFPKFKSNPEKKQSYFEILDCNGEIRTIKQRNKISGYFSEEQLNKLLDEKIVEGNICLLRSINHVMHFGYRDGKWIFYDPNFDHSKLPIHLIFETGSKEDMIKKIIERFNSRSLAIEIASIDENRIIAFPYLDEIINTEPSTLLQGAGLHILAKHDDDTLMKILKTTDSKEKTILHKAIQTALKKLDRNKTPGLHMVIKNTPQLVLSLLELIDDSDEGQATKLSLADALMLKDSGGWTGLHHFSVHAPQALKKLFDLVDDSKAGQELHYAISSCLAEKEQLGSLTGLYVIAKNAPQALTHVLQLVLTDQKENNEIEWLENILETLATTSDQGLTGWDMIHLKAHPFKKEILKILLNHIEKLDLDVLTTLEKDLSNAQVNPNSKYRGLCKEHHSFLIKYRQDYGKTTIWRKLYEKTQSVLSKKMIATASLAAPK